MERKHNTGADIADLIAEARASDDPEEMELLAGRVFEHDPGHPEGFLLLAKANESDADRISLLEKARDSFDARFSEAGGDVDLLVEILQELVVSLLAEGRPAEGADVCREILDYDPDGLSLGRTLLYRCLIEDGRFAEVLEEALADPDCSLAREHAVAIATFLIDDVTAESWRTLWNVFRAGAAVPFLMLGYLETSGDAETDAFAEFYADAWSLTVPLRNWLTGGMLLFGEMTGRLEMLPRESFDVLAESLRVKELLEEVRIRLFEAGDAEGFDQGDQDAVVIDVLASVTSEPGHSWNGR